MALIDESHATLDESTSTSWSDILKNTKILLHEYDAAILALTTGGHQSYELSSGQSSQRVTRLDLSKLMEMRSILISQIADLELLTGDRKSSKQCVPWW